MLLERGGRAALRNFSTLFLLAASFLLPLHLAFALIFQDVIAVHELHGEIATFNDLRQVRNVGSGDLTAFRIAGVALLAVELALVPIATKAARRVIELDEAGGLPTVWDAWRNVRGSEGIEWRGSPRGPLIVAFVYAIALGWILEKLLLLIAELATEDGFFALYALAQGTARSAAAPFLLAAWVMSAAAAKGPRTFSPNLY